MLFFSDEVNEALDYANEMELMGLDKDGECDNCNALYEIGSQDNRCGNCCNCSNCCTHKEAE